MLELRLYELQANSISLGLDLPELPKIICDGPQLQQVFLNIIVNAEQAMLQANGRGHLEIKTQQSKDKLVISIHDDGPGITPEHLKRIFEPFFTTKEPGKSSGIGLSICYGVIQEHGGRLYAESEPGKGTTFFVELPIVVEKSESKTTEHPKASLSEPARIAVVPEKQIQPDILGGEKPATREAHAYNSAANRRHGVELLGTPITA